MKKLYTLLLGAGIGLTANAQLGQLLNRGFENWQNIVVSESPDQWGNTNTQELTSIPLVTKSTDAQHLTYSVKMENEVLSGDSIMGYVVFGNPGDAGLSGMPYTTQFDQLNGYYKCDMFGNDTAYAIVVLSKAGVETPVIYPFYGTHSTWTAFSIPVPNIPVDSLFVGFVSTNPFSSANYHPSSWLMIDNITLANTVGPLPTQLPNPSFETWVPNTVLQADNWYSFNQVLQPIGLKGVDQTTDAYAGTYAAKLETHALPMWGGDTLQGILSLGAISMGSSSPFAPVPYTAEPTTFSGYYKNSLVGIDESRIMYEFYSGGTPIFTNFVGLSPSSTYTLFTSTIALPSTPDSLAIIFSSGDNPGSVLYLDELSLSGGNVGINEMAALMGLNVYPNPASNLVTVSWENGINENSTLTVFDITGKQVMQTILKGQQGANSTTFDVSMLTSGTYTYTIKNSIQSAHGKLVVE